MRWSRAPATAAESGAPTATSPATSPASATPMPPGTGTMPVSSVTPVLTSSSSPNDAEAPKAWIEHPSTTAYTTWVARLAPSSRTSRPGEVTSSLALWSAAATYGHTRARSLGSTTATIPMITAPTPTATPSHTSVLAFPPLSSLLPPVDRWTPEVGMTTTRISAWTTNPANPSIDPWVSATAIATPWRWRKRVVRAIFPAALGTVRLMNFTADWRTMVGPVGRGRPPADSVAKESVTRVQY